MDILADTGILLRFMEPSDPSRSMIVRAVSIIRSRSDRLIIAPQNAAEFWNVCTRPKTSRGGMGLSVKETDNRLIQIERGFPLLYDDDIAYQIWRSLVLTQVVLGKQVHDARLVALMQAHGITHILTLNGSDFARYPGITAIDPASLLAPAPPQP